VLSAFRNGSRAGRYQTASPLAASKHPALHRAWLRGHEAITVADQTVKSGKLPRKHKLGVSHRDPSPSKRNNIPPLPIDELTRAIDLRTDGCQIRHGPPSEIVGWEH
jgi:hypothetical protein